jgi:hypothetical protein
MLSVNNKNNHQILDNLNTSYNFIDRTSSTSSSSVSPFLPSLRSQSIFLSSPTEISSILSSIHLISPIETTMTFSKPTSLQFSTFDENKIITTQLPPISSFLNQLSTSLTSSNLKSNSFIERQQHQHQHQHHQQKEQQQQQSNSKSLIEKVEKRNKKEKLEKVKKGGKVEEEISRTEKVKEFYFQMYDPTNQKQKFHLPKFNQDMTGKIFSCPFDDCNWVFKRREHLKRHIFTHTGEKTYCCIVPNCKRRFSRVDNLNQHLRTHKRRKELPDDFE